MYAATLSRYFCLDCAQMVIHDAEKALDGEIQDVFRSTLTDEWVCDATGNEHRPGNIVDYVQRVHKTLENAQELFESGDISAVQALHLILIDSGMAQRPPDWNKTYAALIASTEV